MCALIVFCGVFVYSVLCGGKCCLGSGFGLCCLFGCCLCGEYFVCCVVLIWGVDVGDRCCCGA